MNNLTNAQVQFLRIVESFMRGTFYQLPDDFSELQELFKLAATHNLLPVVYEQIRNDNIWKKSEWQGFNQFWKRSVIKEVMLQTQRTEGFLRVYKKLKEEDIKPLVVKGLVCRNLYYKPDYRTSGDEDIVIKRELVEKADQIFRQEGFRGKEKEEDKFQQQTISYINMANGVYIEVQPNLFDKEFATLSSLNREFEDMFENYIVENIQGEDVYTLEPTKHFLYLIYHAFKHFVTGGVGIRQLCDMVMMAEYYKDSIDWDHVIKCLKELQLDGFCKGLEQIAEHYFGFERKTIQCTESLENIEIDYIPLLMDLLEAGSFGKTSEERKDSTGMTLMAVEQSKNNGDVKGDNFLFPNIEYMKKSVPWLKKYPWLLPVGYLVRIFRYLGRSASKNEDEKNSLQIGAERVELLKKYNIIK